MEDQARILVVDDERHFRFAVGIALRSAGFHVSEAEDGRMGLSLITGEEEEGRTFDAVLLDLDIPGMSGLEVIAHMRARGILTPVFVVTGYADGSAVEELMTQGGVDILFKPFDPRYLIELVNERLGRRRSGE